MQPSPQLPSTTSREILGTWRKERLISKSWRQQPVRRRRKPGKSLLASSPPRSALTQMTWINRQSRTIRIRAPLRVSLTLRLRKRLPDRIPQINKSALTTLASTEPQTQSKLSISAKLMKSIKERQGIWAQHQQSRWQSTVEECSQGHHASVSSKVSNNNCKLTLSYKFRHYKRPFWSATPREREQKKFRSQADEMRRDNQRGEQKARGGFSNQADLVEASAVEEIDKRWCYRNFVNWYLGNHQESACRQDCQERAEVGLTKAYEANQKPLQESYLARLRNSLCWSPIVTPKLFPTKLEIQADLDGRWIKSYQACSTAQIKQ